VAEDFVWIVIAKYIFIHTGVSFYIQNI